MANFICKTQNDDSTYFVARPSGNVYTSFKGSSFYVHKEDVEHFLKHPQRFKKVILQKVAHVLTQEEKFAIELKELPIKPESIEPLVKMFGCRQRLEDVITRGLVFDPNIDEVDKIIIQKWILKEPILENVLNED